MHAQPRGALPWQLFQPRCSASARSVALVRLCVFPFELHQACRREAATGISSGEAHASSTGPRQARVHTIVSSAHWLLLMLSTDMKQDVGVCSLAQSVLRAPSYTSPAVFCCLFSEAGLAGQYHGSVSLPSPGT